MTTSTSLVATSTTVPVSATAVKAPRLQPLLFSQLVADGSNYLLWAKTAKAHVFAENLSDSISFDTVTIVSVSVSPAIFWKTLLLLRRHIVPSLQHQYLEIDKPDELWKKLKSRFDHQKTIFLPRVLHDWTHLRVLDFPTFVAFNNELYRIVSQLRLCGQTITEIEMIEKTLSTFLSVSVVLAQQYRNMKFETHLDLMSLLLLAEKQNEILLRNAKARPIGTSLPESHTVKVSTVKPKTQKHRFKPCYRQIGSYSRDNQHAQKKNTFSSTHNHGKRPAETRSCHKCGRVGHLTNVCRTSDYFVKMFQENKKLRAQGHEAHTMDASMDPYGEHDMETHVAEDTSTGGFSKGDFA